MKLDFVLAYFQACDLKSYHRKAGIFVSDLFLVFVQPIAASYLHMKYRTPSMFHQK
jgi:hypothetical protein